MIMIYLYFFTSTAGVEFGVKGNFMCYRVQAYLVVFS